MFEKRMIWSLAGTFISTINYITFPLKKDTGTIVRFDPSKSTDNLGDYIIVRYCSNILNELFTDHLFVDISVHKQPTQEDEFKLRKTKYSFVCGTNLLTSHIEQWWNWRLPDGLRRKLKYRNVILLGVGWKNYEEECSDYSRMIYRCILNPSILHSVRDSYTEKKLKAAGIKNVINTGCPTMWRLTPEFCASIPHSKAKNVITTVTDYRQDAEHDNQMLDILSRNYETVYLWIQGRSDEEYIQSLRLPTNLQLIPASLDAYEGCLTKGDVDYVGTRLHAGIFALNHHIRSVIVAVDNRATEMARDTNLMVVQRKDIARELEKWIVSSWETKIKIKQDNINLFKEQFKRDRHEKRT